MIHANQHVPSPTAQMSVAGDATGSPARDGFVFVSEARDQTGAGTKPAGSASGVYTSATFMNPAAQGIRFFANATTGAATGTAVVKLQAFDPASQTWFDIPGATTTGFVGPTGTGMITMHPAITSGASSPSQHLGPVWRAVATVTNASITFSVGASYLI